MALENVRESATLTGVSMIEDTEVVQFTTNVASNGIAGAITVNIRDITKYNEHRSQVRRDQAEFQQEVWEVEDRLTAQITEETEEEATE